MNTPTLNVNLNPCTCHPDRLEHHPRCSGVPVPIPCPVQRSVTFTVVLGECTCGHAIGAPLHMSDCPARHVRVSFSITGTWADSEVTDLEIHATPRDAYLAREALVSACRDLWGILKALVLGESSSNVQRLLRARELDLFDQRDTVFAALADLARAEEDALQAQQRFYEACSIVLPTERRDERPSTGRLAAFVDYLVEQVGALP